MSPSDPSTGQGSTRNLTRLCVAAYRVCTRSLTFCITPERRSFPRPEPLYVPTLPRTIHSPDALNIYVPNPLYRPGKITN